jgi:GMP synthase (glutamine-hydrolysing)
MLTHGGTAQMVTTRTMALLKVGATFDSLVMRRGDYDTWFANGLGLGDALSVFRVSEGEPLLEPTRFAGIVVSGSSAMVTDRAPWSVDTAAFLLSALAQDVPVLGVCYGHQLLADALGGEVGMNPRGRQIGTVEAVLTDAGQTDPLFSGLSPVLTVQTSHRQSVLSPPPDALRLATSPRDPFHAFRVAEKRAWGVQFHPEFDADVTRTYISERQEQIRAEGDDPAALLSDVRDSVHGRDILRRFARICGFE